MLQSNDNRSKSFDAFFRSLDDATRTVFLDEALAQWHGIQSDEPSRTVSFIDCMENTWDAWREFPELEARGIGHYDATAKAITQVMSDPERIARQREYFDPQRAAAEQDARWGSH